MRKAKFWKPSHHAAEPADFKADVQKIADEWRVAFKNKDVDKVASMYTDDAVFINPEGSFHGSGDIKGEFKQMIERGNTTDTITTMKAVQSGDLGYAEGTYTGKAPTQSGAARQMRGPWVITLKKVKDKWLLATHTSLPVRKVRPRLLRNRSSRFKPHSSARGAAPTGSTGGLHGTNMPG